MPDQPGLFETPKETGYPKIMKGKWKDFPAYALVNSSEREKELLELGYERTEHKGIPIGE